MTACGGWCRSIEDNGFTFDFAGHIMFSNDPYVHQMYKMLLGDNVHWQDREAWIYSKGVYTRYPFQGALYGLPPHVIKECIIGAIEARFGPSLRKRAPRRMARQRRRACTTGAVHDCCADGIMESTAPLESAAPSRSRGTSRSSSIRCGVRVSRSISRFPTTGNSGPCRSTKWKHPGWAGACRCRISKK